VRTPDGPLAVVDIAALRAAAARDANGAAAARDANGAAAARDANGAAAARGTPEREDEPEVEQETRDHGTAHHV
jgi:hypothetical protein